MSYSYDYSPLERVIWNKDHLEGILDEVERQGAERIFIVASRTLSTKTEEIIKLRKALGKKFVGLFDSCKEHSPLENILECALKAKESQTDLIVTIGGGSPIDTVKIVQLCITKNISTPVELLSMVGTTYRDPSFIRQIAVPTTLSGGEYSSIAGGTDTNKQLKVRFSGYDLCPKTIILDPKLSLHTPEWLWLSTAIRSVDHAIEGFCSTSNNPLIPLNTMHSLKLFSKCLRETKKDPRNLEARLMAQQAVWITCKNLGSVPMGASHGIGYLLGTIGAVPHGLTSCVMLPAVLKWNEGYLGQKQQIISDALEDPGSTASQAVTNLLKDLGLPITLSEVGIKKGQWDQIAKYGKNHPVVQTNPRPINSHSDILEILELAS